MLASPVAFVIPWYGHFAGGAEVAARQFATQLAARGAAVEVLTTCCRTPYESWWKDTLAPGESVHDGVRVRRFPVNTGGESEFHAVNHKLVTGQAVTPEDERRFLRHSINSDALVKAAGEAARRAHVVALPYTQGLVADAVAAGGGRAFAMPCLHDEPQAYWSTTRAMLGASRRALFLSEAEKSLAIRLHGTALGRRLVESPVVGVGAELPAGARGILADPARQAELRAQRGLPACYHVCVGRKERGKNVHVVVDWYARYRAAGGAGELVFLGGGDDSLVPATPGFRDLGFVSEEEKFAILAGARALVNLSENESFSIVVFEAWLAGTPVIVSARCAVTKAFCDAANGGFPVGDEEEFRHALVHLDWAPTRATLGTNGRRHARDHFNWDAVMDRLALALEGP